ncbi:PP2C family serine/threonine-protein phosphatase [Pseudokineococcus sp. 1T1Z-3]|uniref:PP2C family serine/threonine-protein phosphatase n=1 Tax=Pseudokineococcus sp. 1T1Z-3 TaxID=3132745 RepID=UPI00309E9CFF
MPTALRYAARSHVGLVRSSNQDSAYVGPHLLAVADGMGGHAGGDVASALAVAELSRLEGDSHADAERRLVEAASRATRRLVDRVREEPALAGMGTTVTALLRTGDRLVLAHIGDSRAYLLRGGVLSQVTHDHTFVQHLVDEGRISPQDAEHHPQRSVVLRVLRDGGEDERLDTSVREARTGDRWLLCSDGLSGMVAHEAMRDALAGVEDVGQCADVLVELALHGGGSDNVTVVVADVVDARTAPPDHVTVVGAAASQPGLLAGVTPATPGARTAAGDAPAGGPTSGSGSGSGRGSGGQPSRRGSGRLRRPVWPRALAGALVAVLLVGGALAAWTWSQRQYFVGADQGGAVGVYRGLPQDLGPLSMSSEVSAVGLRLADLPPVSRQRVEDGITTDSREAAEGVALVLLEQACPASEATPTPTEAPTEASDPAETTEPAEPATAEPTEAAGTEDVPPGCSALDQDGGS